MKYIVYSVLIIFLNFCSGKSVKAQSMIDVESGLVFTTYNDVRIPGDKGSFFSLKEDLSSEGKWFYRLRAGYTVNSRHTFSLLYAPLETKSAGIAAKDIFFQGVLFPANTLLKGTYKFNSYRLTYRYDIINKESFVFGLGLTAKIRDAGISLTSDGLNAAKTNVGFVPIIHFKLLWKINDRYGLLIDGDALAAPQGRAEDVLFAISCELKEDFDIRIGYRILEGGADNSEVYNFSLFQYASIGVSYGFGTKTISNQN